MPVTHRYIVAFIILLLVAIVCMLNTTETFDVATNKTDVFTSNPLQFSEWLNEKYWKIRLFKYNPSTWTDMMPMLKDPSVRSRFTGNTSISVLCDPYDANAMFNNFNVIKQAPTGYFVALFDVAKAIQVSTCSYNFAGKTIGYMGRSEHLFARAIMKGYRIPDESVKLQYIPMDKWDDITTELAKLDLIICYIIPGSAFHKLLQTQDMSIMGFRNLDIHRIRLFYPYVEMLDVDLPKTLLDVPGSAMKIMAREKNTTVVSMKMQLVDITGSDGIRENFVTRLDVDETANDPAYRCFGDLSIENKSLCDSKYDAIGLPKRKTTYWDRPCVEDADCPFYKANKNYSNNRGGCSKEGYCEFPIGIRRLAYRLYDDRGVNAPFCYQCKKSDDPNCCKDQKHSWVLSSPDYAFPNDTAGRQKHGMTKTTIDTL